MECPHFQQDCISFAKNPPKRLTDILQGLCASCDGTRTSCFPRFLTHLLKQRVREVAEASLSYHLSITIVCGSSSIEDNISLVATFFTDIVNDESQKLYDRARTLHSVTAT